MVNIVLKINDVYHEEIETSKRNEIEDYVNDQIKIYDDIRKVKISWGKENSPMFITLESRRESLQSILNNARLALRAFESHREVKGCDVEDSISKGNVKVLLKN